MPMLKRYVAMKKDAKERGIKISNDQLATLVLADIIEDTGIELSRKLANLEHVISCVDWG